MNNNLKTPNIFQLRPKARTVEEPVIKTEAEELPANANETQAMLNSAKMHAGREIRTFREESEKLCKFMEESVLFNDAADTLHNFLIEALLESYVSPVVYGNRPAGVPEEIFKETRRQVFFDLINKYVKKEND